MSRLLHDRALASFEHAKGIAIWCKGADGQWRCVVDICDDTRSR
jgi:ketosteroid isomerase-like protein